MRPWGDTRRPGEECAPRATMAIVRAACAVILATFAFACESAPPQPSALSSMRRVVVLGDSLAVSPSVAEGFPAQLQSRVDRAALGWRVTNAGVSGDTTA